MDGHLREVYRRLFWAPVEDDDGTVMGTWHVTRDTTPTVVGNRRVGMLRDLGDCLCTCSQPPPFSPRFTDLQRLCGQNTHSRVVYWRHSMCTPRTFHLRCFTTWRSLVRLLSHRSI